jgi:hypothetical protein
MNRHPVSSSNIVSIGYDERTMTLEVEFHSGAVYQYYDVPVVIYRALMQAASHGQFLNAQVKGAYRYARV